MHLSCVCTTQIYTGSLAAMFSPPKCILSHLPEYLDFQKVQEFLRVVPKHTWYIACAMWLRQARSRGWTTSWVAVAVYVHSFKRFKVSRTSSLVPYPKKPSESWPKSCDVTRTLLSFFVVGSRVHFNSMKDSDFVQQMVKAASVAFGGGRTNDYPKAWFQNHEPCTSTVYSLFLFFWFCDWSFTGGWCVAILILNVLRDKFHYDYE